jgi:hypothetical protein
MQGFNPEFDDCTWTEAWVHTSVMQVVPGMYGAITVKSWQMSEADICGRRVSLTPPLEVRGLFTSDGTLWMSDVPQERLMMVNNAQAARGHTLIGGLGLGLYPQYALPHVKSLTIIERDPQIIGLVGPLVEAAASAFSRPLIFTQGELEASFSITPTTQYDTIFLDTWEVLDAALLPRINRLRNLALAHLAPGGQVMLWGYRWMLRLFEDACAHLLRVAPAEREAWLQQASSGREDAWALLSPVLERYAGQQIEHMDMALAWCHSYAITVSE